MNLTLIRGLPGSGKSELAQVFKEFGWTHFAVNEYQAKQDIEFNHSGSINHESCQSQVMMALEAGRDIVVTHNFIDADEITAYRNIALSLDQDITVIVCDYASPTKTTLPSYVLDELRQKWKDYPGEINIASLEQLRGALEQMTETRATA